MIGNIRITPSGYFRAKYVVDDEEVFDKKIYFSTNKTSLTTSFFDLVLKDFFTGKVFGNDGTDDSYFYVSFTTDYNPNLDDSEFLSKIDFTNVTANIDKIELPTGLLYSLNFIGSYTDVTDTERITGIAIYYYGYENVDGAKVPKKYLIAKNIELDKNSFFNNVFKFSNKTEFYIEFTFSVNK